MIEACERRILEFPLDMDAREVAKELKREGWYAWASDYESMESSACGQKRETEGMRVPYSDLHCRRCWRSCHRETRVIMNRPWIN
jgi:hypothetical protein